jgi:hypothetical protein
MVPLSEPADVCEYIAMLAASTIPTNEVIVIRFILPLRILVAKSMVFHILVLLWGGFLG